MEAVQSHLGPHWMGARGGRGAGESVVRVGRSRQNHQDLGSGDGQIEALAHWSHLGSARSQDLRPPPLPLLGWRRQIAQVLGSRVQQGNPPLPRTSFGYSSDRLPSHSGRARQRGQRLDRQSVGHAHEGADPLPGRPHEHGRRLDLPVGRPPGDHGVSRFDDSSVGSGGGKEITHPSQEIGACSGPPSLPLHVRLRVS
ncbi:hypothetical protein PENTCL1PPCAC_1484 [Pristionchus entomophagus]|uniref:Uncharacterized protein n=1 Tax=Pristionchus entomophagus TaxID=358040 RepID=A0AAV5S9N9_9BILA|nr:hypothetical protein PENTCL1PPCAC_1484 [Pristionchus entomophagus]